MTDPIVESVRAQLLSRSETGILKYGTTLDRTDLTRLDWIQHLQEELLDAVLYIERIKVELRNQNKSLNNKTIANKPFHLEPCPLCGGPVEWVYTPWNEDTQTGDDGTGYIICQHCYLEFYSDIRGEAESKWNNRIYLNKG